MNRRWVPLIELSRRQAAAGLLVVLVLCGGPVLGCGLREAAQDAERDRVLRAVLAYHHRHGCYPRGLDETGVVPDPGLFPYAGYCSLDGTTFDLTLGTRWFLGCDYWDIGTRRMTWSTWIDD